MAVSAIKVSLAQEPVWRCLLAIPKCTLPKACVAYHCARKQVGFTQKGERIMRFRLAVFLLIFTGTSLSQSGVAALTSPDGNLTITFRTVSPSQPAAGVEPAPSQPAPNGGQLVYEVSFHGKPLVEASALRLDLKDQSPLGTNVRIVECRHRRHR